MAPQPIVSAGQGASPLDRFLGCHQWLALGVGVDPATMLSARDLGILEALGARFIGMGSAIVGTVDPARDISRYTVELSKTELFGCGSWR
jgi:hypothetical protein